MPGRGYSVWRTLFRLGLALWLLCLIAVSTAGLSILAYQARYSGLGAGQGESLIFEGVTVLGVPVGGLSREQARAELERALRRDGYPYVTLHTSEQQWTLSTGDLGARWDLDSAVAQAWALGRSGIFRHDLVARFELFWRGFSVQPEFSLASGPGLVYLRQIARQAGHPARRANLRVGGLEARSGAAQVGRELDIAATRVAMERAVQQEIGHAGWELEPRLLKLFRAGASSASARSLEPVRVRLEYQEIVPPITEVQGARERAAQALAAPLILVADLPQMDAEGWPRPLQRYWAVDQAELSTWLTLDSSVAADVATAQVALDGGRLLNVVERISKQIQRATRQGLFDYDPDQVALHTLDPGQLGHTLDAESAAGLVAQHVFAPDRLAHLPVRSVAPPVMREDLERAMPLQLIGEGESSFQGSSAGRLQNIRVAAERFRGATAPPRATFSFLDQLGLVTVANDYSLSWVIFGDRTVLGPGGGVCQVSTTCFRAAFWGGLPIVERRPHAYRVSWYEPPLGLDAAVFSPTADMRFQNDTDGAIIVRPEVDLANAKLYFRFYGRATGRTVSMAGPVSSNPVKAGEPVLEEDPSLAPGQRIQLERAHDGLDVTVSRVIEAPGQGRKEESFFSRYSAWPARYKVGPTAQSQ